MKSASLSLLRCRAARREAEVPAAFEDDMSTGAAELREVSEKFAYDVNLLHGQFRVYIPPKNILKKG